MSMSYNRESNADSSTEKEDDAIHMGWIWLSTEDVNFSSYVSVGSAFAMCGFSSINELCDD
jgi:hypothetical protein